MSAIIELSFAGSGKTSSIVESIANGTNDNSACVTYTIRNQRELSSRLGRAVIGRSPRYVVFGWFPFIVHQLIAPYLPLVNHLYSFNEMRSLNYDAQWRDVGKQKKDTKDYYLDPDSRLYAFRASDLAIYLDDLSGGAVIDRITQIFDSFYFDEFQDFSGYDLDILGRLIARANQVHLFGDHRQSTYSTHREIKNKKFNQTGILSWAEQLSKHPTVTLTQNQKSFRCNQAICDLAHSISPANTPSPVSLQPMARRDHTGIFGVLEDDLDTYTQKYNPVVLRWNSKSRPELPSAFNFGESKGSTFDDVLIIPTKDIAQKCRTETWESLTPTTQAKLYVAVTRARHSVAFLIPSARDFKIGRVWSSN